ncbi:single-stranded DNA-binding protein [Candidatus Thorarchaeota archaeon]|nr:MAG: single-stranded DNA-binding protein [Candidatus Thorarchaeota archaeon]
MSYDREPVEATVANLKPGMKNVSIAFRVLEKGDEREVTTRGSGEHHRVMDAVVGDSTGTVTVPLWDDSIDNLEVDQTYNLKNGYTKLFRGNLQLNIGKYGEISEAEAPIDEVNEDVDMSAEKHEDDRYRGNRGGGNYRGNRGGRSGGGRDNRGRRDNRERSY